MPVPRQNRVTPAGEIIAAAERGTFMGNRGVLHDEQGNIKRAWQLKRWLVCVLEFRGRKRTVMTPGRYTELFFLEEATALAAGHRPCAECRHKSYVAFRDAWKSGNPGIAGSQRPSADVIDQQLHLDRLTLNRLKRSFIATLRELPSGVFVKREGQGRQAFLLWGDCLLAWSPGDYRQLLPRPGYEKVLVLTPKSTVCAIQAGYVPQVHVSAGLM